MREAEKKSSMIFVFVMAVIYVLVIAAILIFPTYMRDYAQRAGWAWNAAGVLAFVYSYYGIYKAVVRGEWLKKDWLYVIVGVAAIFICVGFNLDTYGIKDRP